MSRAGLRIAGCLLAGVAVAAPAAADHQNGHLPPPGPAKVRFAADFPKLTDTEWGFALGGFGGVERGAPRKHAPVIFVHGNNVDHADWYLVRDDFVAAGWNMQELWGLAYNGLGNESGNTSLRNNDEGIAEHREMGGDGIGRIANNDLSAVPDLVRIIDAVRAYTGSRHFSLVSHSLGVTVARKALKIRPDLRADLIAFVGIAGGNHGTSLCPPGTEGNVYACDEVAANTPWLADLNGVGGIDETYPPAKWMTIYDGSGAADGAFAGTYADSPTLRGADNRAYSGTSHNYLRVSPDIVRTYRAFIEAAERARGVTGTRRGIADVPPPPPLPPTGNELPWRASALGLGALSAGALILQIRQRRIHQRIHRPGGSS